MEDLSYAVVQMVHNFGVVAVVGGAIFALCPSTATALDHKLAWLVGFGWVVQAISGMGFAAVSYYFYEQFPDIHGIAMAALFIKISCAVFGISLAIVCLRYSATLTIGRRHIVWLLLAALGITALAAAAFLRWFS